MKRIALAAAIFTVMSANTCKNGDGAATAVDLAGKQWNLQSLAGEAVKLADGQQPWVKAEPDGALSGFGGCNSLMGSMKLEGSSLSFPGLGSTKKFCQDTNEVEMKFKNALSTTTGFKLDGNTLTLLNGATELAKLVSN